MERNELIDYLEKLTATQLTMLFIRFKEFNDTPDRTVPDRVADFIKFAESSVGPGLESVEECIKQLFPARYYYKRSRRRNVENASVDMPVQGGENIPIDLRISPLPEVASGILNRPVSVPRPPRPQYKKISCSIVISAFLGVIVAFLIPQFNRPPNPTPSPSPTATSFESIISGEYSSPYDIARVIDEECSVHSQNCELLVDKVNSKTASHAYLIGVAEYLRAYRVLEESTSGIPRNRLLKAMQQRIVNSPSGLTADIVNSSKDPRVDQTSLLFVIAFIMNHPVTDPRINNVLTTLEIRAACISVLEGVSKSGHGESGMIAHDLLIYTPNNPSDIN